MTLPRNIIRYLAVACGASFALYVVIMVTALYFASSATELAGLARAKEAQVVVLETTYYAATAELAKTDPGELGFVEPVRVGYVDALGAPAFSLIDR